jgi:predicted HicB family RNase H-like nuclease
MKHEKVLIVRVTPEMHAWLKEHRALTGVTVNEFVRRAVTLARFVEETEASK